ncbi:MAG: HNH endonuclease [Proteobacteria bacterium]|nr:HNH endonuclease [Pseudomonadota bacterium]
MNQSVPDKYETLPPPDWNRFELTARRMSDAGLRGADAYLADANEAAVSCLALVLALLPIEESRVEVDPLFEAGLPEGAVTRVEVNRYERSPVNRAICIAAHGAKCHACGFDFGRSYGAIGTGYIEVHHKLPVAKLAPGYLVNPVADLVPLCANCHAMVHRADPPIPVEALKSLLHDAQLVQP